MMTFNDIYNKISFNRENHLKGNYNCIPFTGLSRLEEVLPGIEHATYYLLTASSGVGKSKLGRYLFIHNPLKYIEDNPQLDIELSILYFSLEESKEKVILSEISKYLYTKYGLSINIKQLQSVGRYNYLSEDMFNKIKEAENHVNNFLSKVKIYDSIRNPTGIFKTVRDYALEIGTYYDKNNNPLSKQEIYNVTKGIGEDYKKIAYYKKHNPNHYVLVITDHISLLDLEREDGANLTQWQTIQKFSSKYCLHIRDKFGFTPIIIQQQSSDKEKIDTDFKGKTVEQKLEPSLEGLGDNKTTQRDVNIAIGLFAPDRYNILNHAGYNITKLKDNYRALKILKNRDGSSNKTLPLFFNGAIGYFKELPKSDDEINMEKVYKFISKLRNNNNNNNNNNYNNNNH